MKLSLKCITAGRVHLLEEALYSFLHLYDVENAELIIVNDYPHQKLIFEHPNVKIFNFDELFPTIGHKENFALEQCSGDTFVVFDDDDIALPNHLNNIRKYFVEGTNLLHWKNAAFYNIPHITKLTQVGNSGIVYSKNAWLKIGKSPLENAGGDQTLVKSIKSLNPDKVVWANPSNNEVSWFYRWATPLNYHQSGLGTDTPDRDNIVIRNFKYLEDLRRKRMIPTGEIVLNPHWSYDYSQMLKDYVKNS